MSLLIFDFLLEKARSGEPDAQFKIGQYFFEEQRYGLAKYFLEEAACCGSLEASKFLVQFLQL